MSWISKSEHQIKVEEFMQGIGNEVPFGPKMPDEETRKLRARLVLEEALETIEALGFDVCLPFRRRAATEAETVEMDAVSLLPNFKEDLAKIADGCADLSVVTIGTLSSCGLSDIALLEEVDQNNLDKIRAPMNWDEFGKLIKPADHQPPRIEMILEHQNAAVNSACHHVSIALKYSENGEQEFTD